MLLMLALLAMTATIAIGYYLYIPSYKKLTPQYEHAHPIVVEGAVQQQGAILENGEIKLPFSVLEQSFGQAMPIVYEPSSGTIILTTVDKVLRLSTNSLTAKMNQQTYDLTIGAEVKDGEAYIPITPLEELYGLKAEMAANSGMITLRMAGHSLPMAVSEGDDGTAVRSEPTIRAPIIEQVNTGAALKIWGEKNGWYEAQGPDGHPGYVKKDSVTLTSVDQVPQPKREQPFVAWKVLGTKINMTWEAVYERNPKVADIGALEGVNVVSPTWFELQDGEGKIKSKADPGYVKWAHGRGMQVWALFSNGFETERTTKALASADTRFKMIQQLLAYAELYNLQGINLDFENVLTADREELVQFVRELTPLLHEQGLVVSIDVTPKSNSELWSLFLDRKALGSIVDYMMVMAYDEHWASSPKAGSVASLGWTERSLTRILEEDDVPPSKIILSMPLYTRIWTEQQDAEGKLKVSSKSVSMNRVKEIVAAKKLKPVFDEEAGQNYVEYTESGTRNRIWIEDDRSMQARVALVHKYQLAGAATWARSFQTDSIWKTIDQALKKRP
ncbi:glycosyl hydrolase family 18 protein [Paenibacillus sp. GCM10023252]|uniref:glycosyl hydrolase family 18 protein n=1 Tax=Paenibacillus sp. GCM10023252 TaxID=3252649 RepID=UPI00360BF25D